MAVDQGWGDWRQDPEVVRAQRAVFERARVASQAATAAGVAGRFRAWEHGGAYAVLASDPALAFLSTISGVGPRTLAQALDLMRAPMWAGITATVTVLGDPGIEMKGQMSSAGLVRGPDRALAVRWLDSGVFPRVTSGVDIAHADDDRRFVAILLSGYGVSGTVADYIAAEHSHPTVRRFFAVDDGVAVAAAAMTVHAEVAFLGGASTLPTHRGRGLQSRLIEHRIRQAAESDCELAVATVRPDSPSASNLRRAGFRIHRYSAWTRPRWGARVGPGT